MSRAAREENAEALELGPDFNEAMCLWNSEVCRILEVHFENAKGDDDNYQPPELLRKTFDYVQKFDNFHSQQEIFEARRLKESNPVFKGIHDYEMGLLVNLDIDSVDEAKSLVPSLAKRYKDNEIETILEELKRYRS